jgi:hypothetical protein
VTKDFLRIAVPDGQLVDVPVPDFTGNRRLQFDINVEDVLQPKLKDFIALRR